MIKASCIPCGAELGSFRGRQEYLEWRRQTESCGSCGADLATSLFTSYVKGKPVAEETQAKEENESPGIFGRKKRR